MSDNVYLNADRTAVVPEYAAGKKWQVPRKEAYRLGLLDSEHKPVQRRRTEAPDTPTEPRKPQKRRTARKSE